MSDQPEPRLSPPISDQMREQAKQTPNSWLYIVDPGYETDGDDIPPEGVVGAYRIDDQGEIDEDFHHNDEYVPSEFTGPIPDPTNELERVMHRIAHGEAPETDLPPAVLDAEVMVYAPDPDDTSVYAAEMSDGSQLLPACTSADRVPSSWPGYRIVPGHLLPQVLNGLDLGLNLDDPIRAVIPHGVLVELAEQRG